MRSGVEHGLDLLEKGDTAEASRRLETAVAEAPELTRAVFDLALAFHRAGAFDRATAVYRALLGSAVAGFVHSNMGLALKAAGRVAEAAESFATAIRIRPELAEAHANLGALLQETDRPAAAVAACRRAIALAPDRHEPYMALGHALQDLGDQRGYPAALDRAVAAAPDRPSARYNRAEALLRAGRFAEGWTEYEWRWRVGEFGFRRPLPEDRLWTGQDLTDKTLLITEEQGFGDTIQFIRLATLVRPLCRRLVVRCRPSLVRLVATVAGVDAVVPATEPMPAFDYHVPLLSLMTRLGVGLDHNPVAVPYVSAPPTPSPVVGSGGLRVGLVWAGDPRLGSSVNRATDARRSVALDRLSPLGDVPGVRWVSLQMGTAATQRLESDWGRSILDPMGSVRDFADTAAIIDRLDLVIGVDTAVIHLAGALGKPVWALSRFDGCWRWLSGRDDSPWYPTLRLFRQERPRDWDAVVARVRDELARVVAAGRDRQMPLSA